MPGSVLSPWFQEGMIASPWDQRWLQSPGGTGQSLTFLTNPANLTNYVALDRIGESSTTTGTGPYTLAGALPEYLAVSTTNDGSTHKYLARDVDGNGNELVGGNWEIFLGVYTAATNTLARSTILKNSLGTFSPINWGVGTRRIVLDLPAASLRSVNFNVFEFGAKGDVQVVEDGTMNVGSNVLQSASGKFAASDVGKLISVRGAGSAGNDGGPGGTLSGAANYLITTIQTFVSPNQILLTANATQFVYNSAEVYWGTDDATAINAATLAASILGGIVHFPAATYFVGTAITIYTHVHLRGSGIDTTTLMLAPGSTNDIIASSGLAALSGSNSTGGIHGFSITDMTINGWLYHGAFPHTQLTAPVLPGDTTLNVNSTTGFQPTGTLIVYSNAADTPGETMTYTGTTATSFTGLTRATENCLPLNFKPGHSCDQRASGGTRSPGYGIRIYGYDYILQNLRIHDCEQDGLDSEWSSSTPALRPDSYEADLYAIKSHSNNGHGISWHGPHDSRLTQVQPYANGLHGFRIWGNSIGTQLSACHTSGLQIYGMSLEQQCYIYDCVSEQAFGAQVFVGAAQIIAIGLRIYDNHAQVFSRGLLISGSGISFCVIDGTIIDCNQGSIDLTGDGGNNYIRLQIRQQQGGNVLIGTPNANSNVVLTMAPQNYQTLTGFQSQNSGPMMVRSFQGSSPTLFTRSPFGQTANIFEAQNITGTLPVLVIDPNGRLGIKQSAPTFGLHQVGGSQRLVALATPAAPTVTPFPTGGGTTYTYFIVAEDMAGFQTLVSASAQTTTGPASLNSTNWVRITWSAVAGATKYYVLKTNNTTVLGNIIPNNGQVVTQVAVTAGGSGYTGSAPTVGFSGPLTNQPVAAITVASGVLTSITMNQNSYGTGFTSVPNVVIGGPGNGAAATANMGVANVSSVQAGGSGYLVNDTITLTGGTFATAAVLKVTTVSAGAVTAVAVQTAGSYSVIPSNPVSQGSTSGGGSGATFNLLWGVASVTITNGGTGYTTATVIGFNGGGQLPVATAILAANAVSGISLTSGGAGYTGAPTVVLQGLSAGSGATATASLSTLSMDDTGQSTGAFTNPPRNATADSTIDGRLNLYNALSTHVLASGTIFTATATAVSNTASTTVTLLGTGVGTTTLPANFLQAGSVIRIHIKGFYISTVTSNTTLTFLVKLGSTTICTSAALNPVAAVTSGYFEGECEISCRTNGSSGTVFGQGGVTLYNTTNVVNGVWGMPATATATIDTTATQVIDFQCTQSAGTNAQTLNSSNAVIELVQAV